MRRPGGGAVPNLNVISPRRRSILNRAAPLAKQVQEIVNDDEAERAELLEKDRSKVSSNFSTPQSRRSVVSDVNSPHRDNHYQGCLKLYAENKINKENAWNLQLIDFMSSMLRKHDSRMENLQVASTTLDASARIYSFRVDAIHHDVLKMAGGLSKAAQVKRGKRNEEEEGCADNPDDSKLDNDDNAQKKKEKRKKAAKSSLSTNVIGQLNTEIDVNECIDPFFAQLAATTGDTTSSNRAFNATLAVDDANLGIILRSDIKYLPIEEDWDEKLDLNNLEELDCKKNLVVSTKCTDQICSAFHAFSINDWDPEDEEAENKQRDKNTNLWLDNLNMSHQNAVFDLNADVEPLPENELGDHFMFDNNDDGIESDEDEAGVMSNAIKRDKPRSIARLLDMRPSAQSDVFLEYSYSSAVIGAWAGPAHWKLKNNLNKVSKLPEKSQTITNFIAKKTTSRKKKELDFLGEGMSFNKQCQKCPEYASAIPAKIMVGRKALTHGTSWNEKKFKTPVDLGFNMNQFRKFFLKQNVILSFTSDKVAPEKTERISDVMDYDYNNDNDTSYCPNSQPENDQNLPWLNEECNIDGDVHNQSGVHDDGLEMVEPPPKVAKIFIPYALRAKKVDMKQLKNVTWKMLVQENDSEANKENQITDNEKVSEVNFMELYKKLPTRLSSNMKEALSISLSLLAVLHLANEKGLSLKSNCNYSDFTINNML